MQRQSRSDDDEGKWGPKRRGTLLNDMIARVKEVWLKEGVTVEWRAADLERKENKGGQTVVLPFPTET